MVVYNAVRLYQKADLQNQNSVESLSIVPLWIPFKIDDFPIYQLLFCYTLISSLLIKFLGTLNEKGNFTYSHADKK
jgi:hypothetical protein